MTKICSKCELLKPLDAFAKRNSSKDGRASSCKACKKLWNQAFYLANSDKEKARIAVRRDLQRSIVIQYVKDLKSSTPCTDCKVSYHYSVMDFDHLGNKKYTISEMVYSYSLEKTKLEIAKCEIVCANCHRLRTWKRTQNEVI